MSVHVVLSQFPSKHSFGAIGGSTVFVQTEPDSSTAMHTSTVRPAQLGAGVGSLVGSLVGSEEVGAVVGSAVGSEEVGAVVGSDEGIDDVGLGEGSAVGCAVGKPLGAKVS